MSDADDQESVSALKFIQENPQLTTLILRKSFEQMDNGTQAQTCPCDCRPLDDRLNNALKEILALQACEF